MASTANTITVSLPSSLTEFVRVNAFTSGYFTVGEYVRALIRADQMRQPYQTIRNSRATVIAPPTRGTMLDAPAASTPNDPRGHTASHVGFRAPVVPFPRRG
jgi:hypothetical protein